MRRRSWRRSGFLLSLAAIAIAVIYVIYRWIDPLPPRHLAIAAGPGGSGYESVARRYARILARHRVQLEARNSAGAVQDLELLRAASHLAFTDGCMFAGYIDYIALWEVSNGNSPTRWMDLDP
jgi:hypothetical protein